MKKERLLDKTIYDKIKTIEDNASEWYRSFGPNIFVNFLGRTLYKYNGQTKRGELRSTKAAALESQLHDGYDFDVLGLDFSNMGLSNGYLANEQSKLFLTYAKDLKEHFQIPVYINIVGSLHNAIMGGLTKAAINITTSARTEEYNKQFLESTKRFKIKQNPIPEFNQTIEQHFTKLIEDKEFEIYNANIFSSMLDTFFQKFFEEIENKEALMASLDNLFTMGYAVFKISLKKNLINEQEISLDIVNQPENCFFSPLSQNIDKSDGLFCGIIKNYNKAQLEFLYEDQLKKAGLNINDLTSFSCSNRPTESVQGNINYLTICQYYEKTKNGQIKQTVCCNDFIFEEVILEEFTDLPLIFLSTASSNDSTPQTDGIFNKCFPFQKEYAETQHKLDKMTLITCPGKLLLPGNAGTEAFRQCLSGSYSESLVIVYSPESGTNASFQPTIMENIDLPGNVLLRSEQILQHMQSMIQEVMSNESTRKKESSGAISGISRAIGSLNQSNLFSGRLIIFTNGLYKLAFRCAKMFFNVYKNSSDSKYQILKLIDKSQYFKILNSLQINAFFAPDSSFNKEITRQSIIDLMRVAQNPVLNQVLTTAYCSNLESANQGELLNALTEAQHIMSMQIQHQQQQEKGAGEQDPAFKIELAKIQTNLQDKERERIFKATEAEKDREHDTWKTIVENETRLLDTQVTHNNNITQNNLKAAHAGLSQSTKIANQQTKQT